MGVIIKRVRHLRCVIGLLFLGLAVLPAQAQTLDSLNLGANNTVNALAIQADGKILVGGSFTNFGGLARTNLARINTNGTVDATFTNGANNTVNCLVAEPSGIIVGGAFTSLGNMSRNAIGRLTSSGSVDSFFNPSVMASPGPAQVSAVAVQADGRILLAGYFNSVGVFPRTNIGRLNVLGSVDTFSAGLAGALQSINSLAVQGDGKVLIGGAFTNLAGQLRPNLARLNPNGSLDTNFTAAADGAVTCVALQADGKILVGGSFTNLAGQPRNYLGRLNSDGSLDDSFDPGASGSVLSLAVQADERIVVGGMFTNLAGQPRNFIGRLHVNGSVDDGFNVSASSNVLALALQPDGKILVGGAFTNLAGQSRNRFARLNNTDAATQSMTFDNTSVTWLRGGSAPDAWRTSFDLSTNGASPISFGSGSRVAGGWQVSGLNLPTNVTVRARAFFSGGRHNGSGSYAETVFGAPAIVTQPTSKTIHAGGASSFGVGAIGSATLSYQWRRNGEALTNGGSVSGAQTANLSFSGTFGINAGSYSCVISNSYGMVTSSVVTLTVTDPRITASPVSTNGSPGGTVTFTVGAFGTEPLHYQWRKNGANLPGETATNLLWSNIQSADAGSYFDAVVTNAYGRATSAVAVLTVNLSSPDDFDAGVINYSVGVYSHVFQPDGKIVIGGIFQKIGDYNFDSIARLDSNGNAETNFHPPAGCCGSMRGMALQTDGKILVAGQVASFLSRMDSNGIWEGAFNPATAGPCAEVFCLALQPDGKILVAGSFRSLGGQACTNLGRLNPNGTLDTSFATATAASCSKVLCVALQPDGKILVGGEFGPGDSRFRRFHPDGTPDASFTPASFYQPNAILVQPDGKILVAHGGTGFLGRLNADGTVDNTFNPGVSWSVNVGFGVHTLALQCDGKILVGGQFYAVGGHARQSLARINADGTLDFSFAPSVSGEVYAVGLQADGKIVVGGSFLTLEGQSRIRLGRLNNTLPATQNLSFDGNVITWLRGGTSPEIWRSTFEVSTNGVNWALLGAGVRAPGGWKLSTALLPTNAVIRARGFTTGGQYNASSWFVETLLAVDPRTPPKIISHDSSFGMKTNTFGFTLVALQGQAVVVEGSANLTNWLPILTNTIGVAPSYVSDPLATNSPIRFYRARLR